MRYDQKYFENIFYHEVENSPRNRRRLQELLQYQSAGNLLEIGCGKGHLLSLAQPAFSVSGMDISPYAVSQARKKVGPRVKAANIELHPLQENHFEVILAFNILEHLTAPQESISKIYRALKPGGILMGSVPNNFGLVGGFVTCLSNFFDRTHISTYPTSRWQQLFGEAGFARVELFGEITIGRNNCVYVKLPFWKSVSFNLMFVCKK
jgi:2-polyprenyl-3-methyl-5-hydroxy-6-metoxy-1,4-benzoquinol methylase